MVQNASLDSFFWNFGWILAKTRPELLCLSERSQRVSIHSSVEESLTHFEDLNALCPRFYVLLLFWNLLLESEVCDKKCICLASIVCNLDICWIYKTRPELLSLLQRSNCIGIQSVSKALLAHCENLNALCPRLYVLLFFWNFCSQVDIAKVEDSCLICLCRYCCLLSWSCF